MAYFAELDDNNTVLRVISVSNDVCGEPTLTFPDTEAAGLAYIANTLKIGGVWKQTSYNTFINIDGVSEHRFGGTPIRGCYAGIGFTYDAISDVFIPHGFTYDAVNDVFVAPEITEIVTEE